MHKSSSSFSSSLKLFRSSPPLVNHTSVDSWGCVFSGQFPIPRFHEDKATTPLPTFLRWILLRCGFRACPKLDFGFATRTPLFIFLTNFSVIKTHASSFPLLLSESKKL